MTANKDDGGNAFPEPGLTPRGRLVSRCSRCGRSRIMLSNDKRIDWFWAAVVIYGLGVIVCFGPATVESEIAKREHSETCIPKPNCVYFGPTKIDGVLKAMFWPMWLSYHVAKEYSTDST